MWVSAAALLDEPRAPLRTARQAILDVLRERDMTIMEIAALCGFDGCHVAGELDRLKRSGTVVKLPGRTRDPSGYRGGTYRVVR